MGRRKRAFDLVVSSLLAVPVALVVALLAMLLAVNLRASPFFVQERIGRGGKPFRFVKLRTLPPHCPEYADKYAIAEVQTTRFARFLRAAHLDELPQLFHVLPGTMSLVGPRPEMPELLERYDPEFVEARNQVRPGCTGLWQISADSHRLIGETPHYDLLYVRHATLRLDLWILLRTVRAMIPLSGRHLARDLPEREQAEPFLPAWTTPSGLARASLVDAREG